MALSARKQRAVDKVIEILEGDTRLEVSADDSRIRDIADDLNNAHVRLELAKTHGIVVDRPTPDMFAMWRRGTAAPPSADPSTNPERRKSTPRSKPVVDRLHHTYVPPRFHQDIIDLMLDDNPHNVMFVGPTGSGKTEEAHYLAEALGRRLVQVNCQREMEKAAFHGDRTVDVDKESGQNFVRFIEGPLVQAMTEGLDDDGNEVGPPAILFVDEVGALPAELGIGLNRVLETRHAVRRLTLDLDGGREVKSHSGFRIILAGNTIGRGLTSTWDTGYTAQADALDISTLNRITAIFRFGYSRKAEKSILRQKIGDDRIVGMVLKVRDAFRDAMRQGELQTPFSTRAIVQIADLYRVWNDLGKAFYFGWFTGILPEEQQKCNELTKAEIGVEVLTLMESDTDDYDYF